MIKVILISLLAIVSLSAQASNAEVDTLKTNFFGVPLKSDSVKKADMQEINEIGIIRHTIREFDRTHDDYIEPPHY
jgi:hypothetical protein